MKIMSQNIDLQEHPSGQEYLDGQEVRGGPVNTNIKVNKISISIYIILIISFVAHTKREEGKQQISVRHESQTTNIPCLLCLQGLQEVLYHL